MQLKPSIFVLLFQQFLATSTLKQSKISQAQTDVFIPIALRCFHWNLSISIRYFVAFFIFRNDGKCKKNVNTQKT